MKGHYVEKADKGGGVLYSCMSTQQERNDVGYVNSGCSNHMTRNKKNFVKFDDNFFASLKFGDDKARNNVGKGVISEQNKQGTTK